MHIAKRLQSVEKGEGIDFATAEAMAFGSLLLDGYNVRLCGQDSGRVSFVSASCRTPTDLVDTQGTFSQRHAIFADQNSEQTAVPLQTLASDPPTSVKDTSKIGTFEVVNSPLSEYAVVGFEQGVAWVSPALLPIWEAQFGDVSTSVIALSSTADLLRVV